MDRSLVVATDGAGGRRYRLLESVADYCIERVHEAGEYERLRQRHRRYYTALTERAESHLRGHEQRQWLERLDAETANLRSALGGASRRGDAESALRLVNAMAWYWFQRGRLREAARSLRAVLALDGEAPAGATAKAMAWQAGIAFLAGGGADPVGAGQQGAAAVRRRRRPGREGESGMVHRLRPVGPQ